MLGAITVGLIVAFLALTVTGYGLDLEEGEKWKFSERDRKDWGIALGLGIVVAAISYFAPQVPGLAAFQLAAMLVTTGIIVAICMFWYAGSIGEFFAISLLIMVVGLSGVTAAANYGRVAAMIAVFVPAIAVAIQAMLFKEGHLLVRIAGVVLAFVIAMGLGSLTLALGDTVYAGVGDLFKTKDATEEVAPEATEEGEAEADAGIDNVVVIGDWVDFHNDRVQDDDNKKNDLNYNEAPAKGKSADYYYSLMRDDLSEDPAFASATAVSLDTMTGSDFIGQVLYTGYEEKNNVLQNADAATVIMSQNESIFRKAVSAVLNWLDKIVVKKEVRTAKVAYDQLYMQPRSTTVTGVPGLVCYETEAKESTYLVLTCRLKNGEMVEIWYHIPCGFQWSIPDAEETIGVTPEKGTPSKPSKTSKPSTPNGKGDKPSKPKKKTKKEEPSNPKYKKDPSKGVKDPGKGEKDENTNNPSNPEKSKADTDDSTSNGGKSYEEVKKEAEDKKESKGRQTGGGSGSTPSTPSGGKTTDNPGGSDSGKTEKSSGGSTASDSNDGVVSEPS